MKKEFAERLLNALEEQDPETYDQRFTGIEGPCGCLLRTAYMLDMDIYQWLYIECGPANLYLVGHPTKIREISNQTGWPAPESMDLEAAKIRLRFYIDNLI